MSYWKNVSLTMGLLVSSALLSIGCVGATTESADDAEVRHLGA